MQPHDVILLLQQWTRRMFVVDIKDTDLYKEFTTNHTTTDKVHHISELTCTTDACMDSMTVTPHTPNNNTVMVQAGKLQWFEDIIELTSPMQSPALAPFTTADCDPSLVDPIRWSLLCIKRDTSDYDRLFWAHAVPGEGYPEIPYNGVPLALVWTKVGAVKIGTSNIVNWRSIRPGYAPSAKFFFPPVDRTMDLYNYDDPPEWATCFVASEGVFYYYKDGDWRRSGAPTFDNTAWYIDITATTSRIDLPWPVTKATELAVFRDGMFMTLGEDYNVAVGPSPYIMFTYNIVPGKRITVVRNPFFAQAYSDDAGSDPNVIKYIDIYVDGEVGSDVYDGSEEHPFKTLQRGFDIIPNVSNHIYRVHAKNLKLDDMVTAWDGETTCYGWMRGKKMLTLRLFIENSFEWDANVIDYVCYLNDVGFIEYNGQTIDYQFYFVNCTSAFKDTAILGRSEIAQGNASFLDCTSEGSTNDIHIYGGCVANMTRCTFKTLNISNQAFVRAHVSTVHVLSISQDGQALFTNSYLVQSVTANDAYLMLTKCTITAEGQFTGGWLSVQEITIDSANQNLPVFFRGWYGASFYLYKVQISRMPTYAIVMSHNCTLYMEEGGIDRTIWNGVQLDHSCAARFYHVDLSNNARSGVYAEYSCSIEFVNCIGGGNTRYACECYDLSRANFVSSSVWGNIAQYYELVPGSDTVITRRGTDLVPGTLDEKITLGPGLSRTIEPGVLAGDYKYHIEIDADTLAGSGGTNGQPVININPKVQVYTHTTQITPSGPAAMIDMQINWAGTSYISSITRRVFNPQTQTKQVLVQLATQNLFTEEDKWNGTSMLADGITLVNFPGGVGYRTNNPHFFFSNYDGPGALASYGISSLNSFTVDADVPTGTSLRIAFSVNGSSIWREWNNSAGTWDPIVGNSTLIQMQKAPLHTDVLSWPSAAWDALRQMNGLYITVCFLLATTSTLLTPKVRSYSWGYVEDGFLEDITEYFDRHYYANRAIFQYRGTLGNIDPPVYFSVMPTTNREA